MSPRNPTPSAGTVLAKYVVWFALIGTSLGIAAGLAESVALYPASSWAGVTMYVAVVALFLSGLLGLLAGCAALLARRLW